MQIEFLNVHRGEHLVNFDTDTPEGRAKLAEEFQRLVKCGTAIFLERAGKEGNETLRVTGYDPGTDKIIIEEPIQAEPEKKLEPGMSLCLRDHMHTPEAGCWEPRPAEQRLKERDEDKEHVAPCPKVDGDGDECTCGADRTGPTAEAHLETCPQFIPPIRGKTLKAAGVPEELKDKTAKVGDVLSAKATGRKRRGRYRVTEVDAASGHIIAVAPVSGGLDNAAARARNLFKTAGYSVVYMLKDDFFTLRPLDSHEQKSMGTACLSARAMTVIGNELLSESTGHDAEICRIAAALGSAPQIEDIVAKIKALKK